MNIIDDIRSAFEGLRGGPILTRAFEGWQARYKVLCDFHDLEEIIALLQDPGGDQQAKDQVLSALCTESRSGDERARITLSWLFLPGFLRIHQSLGALKVLDPDDLWAEILAGFWEAASSLKNSSRVAGQLINAARWRATKAIKQTAEYESHREPLSKAFDIAAPGPEPIADDPLEDAISQGVLTELEAELIRLTRLDGYTLDEVASRRNASRHSLRLRRHRAEARLASWLRGERVAPRRGAARQPRNRRVPPINSTGTAGRDPQQNSETEERKEVMPSADPVLQPGPTKAADGSKQWKVS